MTDDLDSAPFWPDVKKVLERDVEGECVRWAKANGWLSYKFTSPSVRGVVDRVFIREGVVIWCELKKAGKRPTALQNKRGRSITEHGGIWFWTDSPDRFIEFMKGYM